MIMADVAAAPGRTPAERLARMVRCRTVTQPEGGDPGEFRRLHAVLEEDYPLVHRHLERTRVCGESLLYRWPGRGPDPAARPTVLMAHQDVVEATGPWGRPPFDGVVADGMVHGRGAIDDKGCLCAILEAVESLLAEGAAPASDLYLAFSHNEETMGDGAPALVRFLEERGVRPALVLDEGGAIVEGLFPGVRGRVAVIGTTEKGYLNLQFVARSAGGHASAPPRRTPLGRLSELVRRVERRPPFRPRLNPVVRRMFHDLAPAMAGPLRWLFGPLWLTGPLVGRLLAAMGGEARAMVVTTCAFTMAQGSGAPNVLPEEASMTANLRVAIHETVAEVLARMERLAKPLDLACRVLHAHEPAPVSPADGEAYDRILAALRTVHPDVTPVPYAMIAATDAHRFCALSSHVYRLSPFELDRELRKGVHGLDERLPAAALEKAVAWYRALIAIS